MTSTSTTIDLGSAVGPTLPPDWQWICCDQDHGSSSRAPMTSPIVDHGPHAHAHIHSTPAPTEALGPGMGMGTGVPDASSDVKVGNAQQNLPLNTRPQDPQGQAQDRSNAHGHGQGHGHGHGHGSAHGRRHHLRSLPSHSGSVSVSGSSFSSPLSLSNKRGNDVTSTFDAVPSAGVDSATDTSIRAGMLTTGFAGTRKGSHRSARSFDPGFGRRIAQKSYSPSQAQFTRHAQIAGTGTWMPPRHVHTGFDPFSPEFINAPRSMKGVNEVPTGSRSTTSSRASTPGLYSPGSARSILPAAAVQFQNQLYPTPGSTPTDTISAKFDARELVNDVRDDPISGFTSKGITTEAQLAQWMTYCCDKDDCVDPFPPPSSNGMGIPSAMSGDPMDPGQAGFEYMADKPYMEHVMFQAMFPSEGTGGPTPNTTPISCTLDPSACSGDGDCNAPHGDPAYCCGGGPDCHEPIIDSIGCQGHPQQCGLPECCPAPIGTCAGEMGMDIFMKGVDWERLDAVHGYARGAHNVPSSGSQTPLTLGSNTHPSNTPHGAFSTQTSPFLNAGSGEAQEFDLGPPAQGTMPSTDQTLEAFLAAVAKGDFFTGEPVVSTLEQASTGDAVMNHVGSASTGGHPGALVKPADTHVCHWQNCHEHFGTVQELLSHVSSEHLKITPSRTQERQPAYQFGTTTSTGLESRSISGSSAGGMDLQLGNRETETFPSLIDPFRAKGFDQADTFMDATNAPVSQSDGLMACLWDDCIPGPEFTGGSKPFTGAFARGATTGESETQDFAKDLESLQLLSHDANMMTPSSVASAYSQHLPAAVSAAQSQTDPQYSHRACHVPVPVQNDNPLDSASAVLKHLLEQHLGTEATNSLLNIAQNHYTSVSAVHSHDQGKGVAPGTSSTGSVAQIPPPRRSSRADARPQSAQATPQRRSSDVKEEATTFQCRWHGCDKVFDTNTALTEHISNIHVGRGKSTYECLWEGCVRCDDVCDSCDEGDKMETDEGEKRGRKFATRQKVLRHIQSHTGYRPFVCHLCGQSVSEQATLNAHLRRHAEEKPFKCDEEDCDKAFASAASLAVHKRAHTGTKTHVCPHCSRGFIELSNLTKHIRTHTGDKPFSCPLNGCGRAFCRSDQLKRHMMTCRYRKASDDDRSSTTPP